MTTHRSIWLGAAVLVAALGALVFVQLRWLGRLEEARRAELHDWLERSATLVADRLDERFADELERGTTPEVTREDVAAAADVLGADALDTFRIDIVAMDDGVEPLFSSEAPGDSVGPFAARVPLFRPNGWVGFFGTGPDGDDAATWHELDSPAESTPPRWLLGIRHRDGSLADVVARAHTQNLVVGGALLVVLVGGIALLLYGERRSRRLAERQLLFVAGVSHELRTPLTVIRTAASNLECGIAGDPERVREYGALIEREAARMGVRVERALRFAGRPGEVAVHEDVAARELIDEAITSCEPWRDRREFRVEVTVEADLPPLHGDRAGLVSALANLLDNAIKYGPTKQTVRVTAGLDTPERIAFEVVDEGQGIAKRERARVFEPFYRAEAARNGPEGGAGLGLSVVTQVAAAHGGDVVLKDASGATAFSLRVRIDGDRRGTNDGAAS